MKVGFEQIRLDEINVGKRFRKELGDLNGLAASMKRGQLHPITVRAMPSGQYELLAGLRRFRAARDVNHALKIWALVFEGDDVQDDAFKLQIEHDENEHRLEPTYEEKLALARTLKAAIGGRQGRRDASLPGNCPEVAQETRDYVAKTAGFKNEREMRRVAQVREALKHTANRQT